MSTIINLRDRFVCKDGVVVEVVDRFHKRQTRSWNVGKVDEALGHVPLRRAYYEQTAADMNSMAWDEFGWRFEESGLTRKTDGSYDPAGCWYLCAVSELDEEVNEFGQISP